MNMKLITLFTMLGWFFLHAEAQSQDSSKTNKAGAGRTFGFTQEKEDPLDKLKFSIGDKLKISYDQKNASILWCDYGEITESTGYDYKIALTYVYSTNISTGLGYYTVMAENPSLPSWRRYDKKNLGCKVFSPIRAEKWDGSDPRQEDHTNY